jgi:cutinase
MSPEKHNIYNPPPWASPVQQHQTTMKLPSLLLLLFPLLSHARTVDIPALFGQEAFTPAEALSHAFRAGHDEHFSAQRKVVTTRNELLQGKCADIIVIFARGSLEPGWLFLNLSQDGWLSVVGNVGDDVGPYFFDELEKLEPERSIVQGVNNYPATICGSLFP